MRDLQPARSHRAPFAPVALVLAALLAALAAAPAFAQGGLQPQPFWNPSAPSPPAPSPSPAPGMTPPPGAPVPVAPSPARAQAAPAGTVIARVGGRAVTQEEFDRLAAPYFANLRAQLGAGFTPELQTVARFNVLDELVRRQILAIEAAKHPQPVTQADIDGVLMQDPSMQTNGKPDPSKLAAFKSSPTTNYVALQPVLRQVAALRKFDDQVRRNCTPTAAQVRAEWTKRTAQVRFESLPLLLRDMPLDSEATYGEVEAFFRAHPDQFVHKAQVHLRYVRIPMPPSTDSTRAAEEAAVRARATAIADSLRTGSLRDTSDRFADSGPVDLPAVVIPGFGRVPGLVDTLNRAEADTTIRVVGPYVYRDAMLVGTVGGRVARRPSTLREAFADAKRRADAEKRRVTGEADRRAFFAKNADRWRGRRAGVTRFTINANKLAVDPPAPQEMERWWAANGRSVLELPDSVKAVPALNDSLRAIVRERMAEEARPRRAAEALGRVAAQMAASRDLKALARANGAAMETLSVQRFTPPDSVFGPVFVDSLLAGAIATRGQVQGPRSLGPWWVVWRVESVDTSYTPGYDAIQARVDLDFAEEGRRTEEAKARAHYDAHRAAYRTPERYGFDVITVRTPDPDTTKVPEAASKREYDTNPVRYHHEEEVRARHILFSARDGAPDTDRRAKASADSLLAAIRKGAGDFGELAKRFSQEPNASNSGGELGWFGRGRMVKEFEDAAFALKPGEVSEVVKSKFGYHIIQLEERHAAGQQPYAEVRSGIRDQLARTAADSLAHRDADVLRAKLAAGGDAAALAKPWGGVAHAAPISTKESLPQVGYVQDLARDMPLIKPGTWAAHPYKTGNGYVVLKLAQLLPPGPAEFDAVRFQATEDMKNVERRAILDRRVAELRAALAAGASFDSLAALHGGLKDSGPLVPGAAFVPPVGNEPRMIERALALPVGGLSDTLQIGSGVAWLRVKDKPAPDPSTFKLMQARVESEMTKQRYDDWLAARRKTIPVVILRPDLKGPRPKAPSAG